MNRSLEVNFDDEDKSSFKLTFTDVFEISQKRQKSTCRAGPILFVDFLRACIIYYKYYNTEGLYELFSRPPKMLLGTSWKLPDTLGSS